MSSDTGEDRTRVHGESLQTVASALASGVAGQLSQPLRELRENLAMMVETIEHYMAEVPGPTPYPWKALHALRQELAHAYLLSREVARLVGDLHDGMTGAAGAMQPIDVNACVESALNLARHRLSSHTEVFLDLGSLPRVRAVHGELVLAIAKLILCCADSAVTREGSAVSIRTHCERGATDSVVICVADNGAGLPEAAAAAEQVVAPVVRGWGGTFEGISTPERGSAFECHLPAIPADALDRVASSGSER